MKIVRTLPDEGWVPVANAAARDHRLSWRARGLLLELLSYPDGWDTTVEQLVRKAKRVSRNAEGRDAMLKAMAELANLGYVRYHRQRDEQCRWTTVIEVCDCEMPGRSRHTESQLVGIPVPRNPGPGDQGVSKKTVSKTDTKKDLGREEEGDGHQPGPGSGHGSRIGEAETSNDWPDVTAPGTGWANLEWALASYDRE